MIHGKCTKKFRSIRKSMLPFLIFSLCFIDLGLLALKPGEEFQVNTSAEWRTYNPEVAMDKKGNFVIAWESLDQDGDGYGIYAQRFNKIGKAAGTEIQVNTTTSGSQQSPAIAMNPKGNFVIVWAYHGIFAQRYSNKGKALGMEFQVNTFSGYTLGNPAIAMDANGNFVVVWENSGIYAQRFNKYGAPLGTEFRVNTEPYQGDPAIARDLRGNFVITWKTETDDASQSLIYAKIFKK